MKFVCVIPARSGFTSIPGYPLPDIAGEPMCVRVYDTVPQATQTECTIVATGDERVYSAVQHFVGTDVMRDPNHTTGPARLPEVASHNPG